MAQRRRSRAVTDVAIPGICFRAMEMPPGSLLVAKNSLMVSLRLDEMHSSRSCDGYRPRVLRLSRTVSSRLVQPFLFYEHYLWRENRSKTIRSQSPYGKGLRRKTKQSIDEEELLPLVASHEGVAVVTQQSIGGFAPPNV